MWKSSNRAGGEAILGERLGFWLLLNFSYFPMGGAYVFYSDEELQG